MSFVLADILPQDGDDCLVMSDAWDTPRVLRFNLNFRGAGAHAFVDHDNGRWYWYPDRMTWDLLSHRAARSVDSELYFADDGA